MSDIFENILKKMNQLSETFTKSSSEVFSKALDKGEDLTNKGKIKLEIEKLKWDIRQLSTKLGKYCSNQTIKSEISDFSHDDSYFEMIEDIRKMQLYIQDLEKKNKVTQSLDEPSK
jgi:thiamine pyrophosphokinase